MPSRNYPTFLYVGQILNIGDTVTSPHGNCVMTLTLSGIAIQCGTQPSYQPPNASGLSGVSGAELKPTYFEVFATPDDRIYVPLTATMLEVQDNGQVIVYGLGSPYTLFAYRSPSDIVEVSQTALTALEKAVDEFSNNMQAKIRALRQTMRPFPGEADHVQDELERVKAPRESGIPGPISPATRVAAKKTGTTDK